MAFVLEILDDQARKLANFDGINHIIDHDRNVVLFPHPKHWQLRAEGDLTRDFTLKMGSKELQVVLLPAPDFWNVAAAKSHEFVWEKIVDIAPSDLFGASRTEIVEILKEALIVYGGGSHMNVRCSNFSVSFKF